VEPGITGPHCGDGGVDHPRPFGPPEAATVIELGAPSAQRPGEGFFDLSLTGRGSETIPLREAPVGE